MEAASATGPAAGGPDLTPRRPWQGRRVLLGVCGGIAAYKVAQLARDLTLLGAEVDVIMTRSARRFVGAVTFEALTGRPVRTRLFEPGRPLEHIGLAREADVVCIAPATADLLARGATGRADDLLCAVLLATRATVLICPAMNDAMWAHAATRANLDQLREYGYLIVEPATGPLAFGEGAGPGRLPEPDVLREHVGRALASAGPLRGRRVLVTAGPTREPVDAVRVLSNRSSGRMGFALAAAAWRRGADVLLIAGATGIEPPHGPELQRVDTAAAMTDAVRAALPRADVLLMAAAVADFRPADPSPRKMKKRDAPAAIPLEPAPDVLVETRDCRPAHLVTVGFALETDDPLENAREKLERKALDLVVLNDAAEPGAGFEVDTNRVVLIERDGSVSELPLLSKDEVAERILDSIEPLVETRNAAR